MYLSNSLFLFAISFPSPSIMKVSSSSWPLIWRMTSQRNYVSTSLPPSRARQGAALPISLMENPVYWVGHCAPLPFKDFQMPLLTVLVSLLPRNEKQYVLPEISLLNVNMLEFKFTLGALAGFFLFSTYTAKLDVKIVFKISTEDF